jgi:hypothetical protein
MDRNTLIGMTTGAAVMFGFGTIWVLLGLYIVRYRHYRRCSLFSIGRFVQSADLLRDGIAGMCDRAGWVFYV